MAVVLLISIVLRLRERKSGQNTKIPARRGPQWRLRHVRSLFVSPAFPLISLYNELELQLGMLPPRGPRLSGARAQGLPGPRGDDAGARRSREGPQTPLGAGHWPVKSGVTARLHGQRGVPE